MKTKGQVIEESYGKHWEKVKDHVDENGWVFSSSFSEDAKRSVSYEGMFIRSDLEVRTYGLYTAQIVWRPKALYGLEINNGFHILRTIEDMPKQPGMYETWHVNGIHPHIEVCISDPEMAFRVWQRDGVTHWREHRPGPLYWEGGEK